MLPCFRVLKFARDFILTVCYQYFIKLNFIVKWDKVFKNGPSKICERQPLKNLKGYGLLPANSLSRFDHFVGFEDSLKNSLKNSYQCTTKCASQKGSMSNLKNKIGNI